QRPRRDRPEEEPIPCLDRIHGRTSFSDSNWKRSTTSIRGVAIGSETPVPGGGESLTSTYRVTQSGNDSSPRLCCLTSSRTACRAVKVRWTLYSSISMLAVNLQLR